MVVLVTIIKYIGFWPTIHLGLRTMRQVWRFRCRYCRHTKSKLETIFNEIVKKAGYVFSLHLPSLANQNKLGQMICI